MVLYLTDKMFTGFDIYFFIIIWYKLKDFSNGALIPENLVIPEN